MAGWVDITEGDGVSRVGWLPGDDSRGTARLRGFLPFSAAPREIET